MEKDMKKNKKLKNEKLKNNHEDENKIVSIKKKDLSRYEGLVKVMNNLIEVAEADRLDNYLVVFLNPVEGSLSVARNFSNPVFGLGILELLKHSIMNDNNG